MAETANKAWRAIKQTLAWLGYSVLWVLCGLSLFGSFQCLVNPPLSEEEARSFAIEVFFRRYSKLGSCPLDLEGPVMDGVYNFGHFFTWSYRREGHTLSAHVLVHKWGRAESSGTLDLDWCEELPIPTPGSEP